MRFGSFEWDEDKARANVRKHGVSFEEAVTVFLDVLAVPFQDSAHTDRMLLIGESQVGKLLLVVFTERRPEGILRIISARLATRQERKAYEEEDS